MIKRQYTCTAEAVAVFHALGFKTWNITPHYGRIMTHDTRKPIRIIKDGFLSAKVVRFKVEA